MAAARKRLPHQGVPSPVSYRSVSIRSVSTEWYSSPLVEFSESLKFEYNSTFTIGDETKVQYAWDQLLSRKLCIVFCLLLLLSMAKLLTDS